MERNKMELLIRTFRLYRILKCLNSLKFMNLALVPSFSSTLLRFLLLLCWSRSPKKFHIDKDSLCWRAKNTITHFASLTFFFETEKQKYVTKQRKFREFTRSEGTVQGYHEKDKKLHKLPQRIHPMGLNEN